MHRRPLATVRILFRPSRAAVLLAVLLLLLRPPAANGDTAEGPEAISVCVFPVVDLSEHDENADLQEIIRRQLEMELSRAGYRLIPARRWQAAREALGYSGPDLATGTRAVEVAKALEAQLAVTGFYRVEDGRIVLEMKVYDVLQRAFITGVLRTGTVDLSIYTLIDDAVARMLPEIRLLSAAALPEASRQVREITLHSPDQDLEVYLAGQQFAGRIRDGSLTLPYFPLAVGSTLRLEKRRPGYYTAVEERIIDRSHMEITLKPLIRQTRWATELNWTSGQAMGCGVAQRWYPRPDLLFLAAENYFYLQHNLLPGARAVLHDDLRLLVGGYPFSRVERRWRFGFSAGLGVILTAFTVPDQPLYADFYLNFLNTWLEYNRPRWTVYLRAEGRYAFGIARNLLGSGFLGNGPALTAGGMWKW